MNEFIYEHITLCLESVFQEEEKKKKKKEIFYFQLI